MPFSSSLIATAALTLALPVAIVVGAGAQPFFSNDGDGELPPHFLPANQFLGIGCFTRRFARMRTLSSSVSGESATADNSTASPFGTVFRVDMTIDYNSFAFVKASASATVAVTPFDLGVDADDPMALFTPSDAQNGFYIDTNIHPTPAFPPPSWDLPFVPAPVSYLPDILFAACGRSINSADPPAFVLLPGTPKSIRLEAGPTIAAGIPTGCYPSSSSAVGTISPSSSLPRTFYANTPAAWSGMAHSDAPFSYAPQYAYVFFLEPPADPSDPAAVWPDPPQDSGDVLSNYLFWMGDFSLSFSLVGAWRDITVVGDYNEPHVTKARHGNSGNSSSSFAAPRHLLRRGLLAPSTPDWQTSVIGGRAALLGMGGAVDAVCTVADPFAFNSIPIMSGMAVPDAVELLQMLMQYDHESQAAISDLDHLLLAPAFCGAFASVDDLHVACDDSDDCVGFTTTRSDTDPLIEGPTGAKGREVPQCMWMLMSTAAKAMRQRAIEASVTAARPLPLPFLPFNTSSSTLEGGARRYPTPSVTAAAASSRIRASPLASEADRFAAHGAHSVVSPFDRVLYIRPNTDTSNYDCRFAPMGGARVAISVEQATMRSNSVTVYVDGQQVAQCGGDPKDRSKKTTSFANGEEGEDDQCGVFKICFSSFISQSSSVEVRRTPLSATFATGSRPTLEQRRRFRRGTRCENSLTVMAQLVATAPPEYAVPDAITAANEEQQQNPIPNGGYDRLPVVATKYGVEQPLIAFVYKATSAAFAVTQNGHDAALLTARTGAVAPASTVTFTADRLYGGRQHREKVDVATTDEGKRDSQQVYTFARNTFGALQQRSSISTASSSVSLPSLFPSNSSSAAVSRQCAEAKFRQTCGGMSGFFPDGRDGESGQCDTSLFPWADTPFEHKQFCGDVMAFGTEGASADPQCGAAGVYVPPSSPPADADTEAGGYTGTLRVTYEQNRLAFLVKGEPAHGVERFESSCAYFSGTFFATSAAPQPLLLPNSTNSTPSPRAGPLIPVFPLRDTSYSFEANMFRIFLVAPMEATDAALAALVGTDPSVVPDFVAPLLTIGAGREARALYWVDWDGIAAWGPPPGGIAVMPTPNSYLSPNVTVACVMDHIEDDAFGAGYGVCHFPIPVGATRVRISAAQIEFVSATIGVHIYNDGFGPEASSVRYCGYGQKFMYKKGQRGLCDVFYDCVDEFLFPPGEDHRADFNFLGFVEVRIPVELSNPHDCGARAIITATFSAPEPEMAPTGPNGTMVPVVFAGCGAAAAGGHDMNSSSSEVGVYECAGERRCVTADALCNGIFDCNYGADELGCSSSWYSMDDLGFCFGVNRTAPPPSAEALLAAAAEAAAAIAAGATEWLPPPELTGPFGGPSDGVTWHSGVQSYEDCRRVCLVADQQPSGCRQYTFTGAGGGWCLTYTVPITLQVWTNALDYYCPMGGWETYMNIMFMRSMSVCHRNFQCNGRGESISTIVDGIMTGEALCVCVCDEGYTGTECEQGFSLETKTRVVATFPIDSTKGFFSVDRDAIATALALGDPEVAFLCGYGVTMLPPAVATPLLLSAPARRPSAPQLVLGETRVVSVSCTASAFHPTAVTEHYAKLQRMAAEEAPADAEEAVAQYSSDDESEGVPLIRRRPLSALMAAVNAQLEATTSLHYPSSIELATSMAVEVDQPACSEDPLTGWLDCPIDAAAFDRLELWVSESTMLASADVHIYSARSVFGTGTSRVNYSSYYSSSSSSSSGGEVVGMGGVPGRAGGGPNADDDDDEMAFGDDDDAPSPSPLWAGAFDVTANATIPPADYYVTNVSLKCVMAPTFERSDFCYRSRCLIDFAGFGNGYTGDEEEGGASKVTKKKKKKSYSAGVGGHVTRVIITNRVFDSFGFPLGCAGATSRLITHESYGNLPIAAIPGAATDNDRHQQNLQQQLPRGRQFAPSAASPPSSSASGESDNDAAAATFGNLSGAARSAAATAQISAESDASDFSGFLAGGIALFVVGALVTWGLAALCTVRYVRHRSAAMRAASLEAGGGGGGSAAYKEKDNEDKVGQGGNAADGWALMTEVDAAKTRMLVSLASERELEDGKAWRSDRWAVGFGVLGLMCCVAASFLIVFYAFGAGRESNFQILYEEYSSADCASAPLAAYMPTRIFAIPHDNYQCESVETYGEAAGVTFATGRCAGSGGNYFITNFRQGRSFTACKASSGIFASGDEVEGEEGGKGSSGTTTTQRRLSDRIPSGVCLPIDAVEPSAETAAARKGVFVMLRCGETSFIEQRVAAIRALVSVADVFTRGAAVEPSNEMRLSGSSSATGVTVVGDGDGDAAVIVSGSSYSGGRKLYTRAFVSDYSIHRGTTFGWNMLDSQARPEDFDGADDPKRIVLQSRACTFLRPAISSSSLSSSSSSTVVDGDDGSAGDESSTAPLTGECLSEEEASLRMSMDDLSKTHIATAAGLAPATGDEPIGYLFNAAAGSSASSTSAVSSTASLTAGGSAAHRYLSAAGTIFDMGFHFPARRVSLWDEITGGSSSSGEDSASDSSSSKNAKKKKSKIPEPDDSEGYTISLYLRADTNTVGFAYAVADSYEVPLEGTNIPLERLGAIIAGGRGGGAWFEHTYNVYHSLYVNGPAASLSFAYAGPNLSPRVRLLDFDLAAIGMTRVLNGQWHHVAVSFMVENGRVRAQLSVDGESSYTKSGWSVCLEEFTEPISTNLTGLVPVDNRMRNVVTNGGVVITGYFGGSGGGVYGLQATARPLINTDFLHTGTQAMRDHSAFPRGNTLALGIILLTVSAAALVFLTVSGARSLGALVGWGSSSTTSAIYEARAVAGLYYTLMAAAVDAVEEQRRLDLLAVGGGEGEDDDDATANPFGEAATGGAQDASSFPASRSFSPREGSMVPPPPLIRSPTSPASPATAAFGRQQQYSPRRQLQHQRRRLNTNNAKGGVGGPLSPTTSSAANNNALGFNVSDDQRQQQLDFIHDPILITAVDSDDDYDNDTTTTTTTTPAATAADGSDPHASLNKKKKHHHSRGTRGVVDSLAPLRFSAALRWADVSASDFGAILTEMQSQVLPELAPETLLLTLYKLKTDDFSVRRFTVRQWNAMVSRDAKEHASASWLESFFFSSSLSSPSSPVATADVDATAEEGGACHPPPPKNSDAAKEITLCGGVDVFAQFFSRSSEERMFRRIRRRAARRANGSEGNGSPTGSPLSPASPSSPTTKGRGIFSFFFSSSAPSSPLLGKGGGAGAGPEMSPAHWLDTDSEVEMLDKSAVVVQPVGHPTSHSRSRGGAGIVGDNTTTAKMTDADAAAADEDDERRRRRWDNEEQTRARLYGDNGRGAGKGAGANGLGAVARLRGQGVGVSTGVGAGGGGGGGSIVAATGASTNSLIQSMSNVLTPLVSVFQGMYVWSTSIHFPNIYDDYFKDAFSFLSVDWVNVFPDLETLVTPLVQLFLGLAAVGLVFYFMYEDNKRFEKSLAQYVWRRDELEEPVAGRSAERLAALPPHLPDALRERHTPEPPIAVEALPVAASRSLDLFSGKTKRPPRLKEGGGGEAFTATDYSSMATMVVETVRGERLLVSKAKASEVVESVRAAGPIDVDGRLAALEEEAAVGNNAAVAAAKAKKARSKDDNDRSGTVAVVNKKALLARLLPPGEETDEQTAAESPKKKKTPAAAVNDDSATPTTTVIVVSGEGGSPTERTGYMHEDVHNEEVTPANTAAPNTADYRLVGANAGKGKEEDVVPSTPTPLHIAGVCCQRHPSSRLSAQTQTQIWPFSNPPTCCLVSNGQICGEQCGVVYSCGLEYEDPLTGQRRVCTYALCARHCRVDTPMKILWATAVGFKRRVQSGGPSWALCALIVLASNLAYTPVMKTALMILGCHPFYQCEFDHCWSDMDQKFAVAVFCCFAVVVLFGIGFPAFLFFVLWSRKRSMNVTFISAEYEGRYATRGGGGTSDISDDADDDNNNNNNNHHGALPRRGTVAATGGGPIVTREGGCLRRMARALLPKSLLRCFSSPSLRISEREWVRFVTTDATALAQQYQQVFFGWMFYPAIAILLKVVALIPAIFVEPRTFEQRLGCAIVQLFVTLFVFGTETQISPIVLLTLRVAEVHQLLILGFQNISLVVLNDANVDIGFVMIIVTITYIVFSGAIFILTVLLPIVVSLRRKRRLSAFLARLRMDYSESVSLFLNPLVGIMRLQADDVDDADADDEGHEGYDDAKKKDTAEEETETAMGVVVQKPDSAVVAMAAAPIDVGTASAEAGVGTETVPIASAAAGDDDSSGAIVEVSLSALAAAAPPPPPLPSDEVAAGMGGGAGSGVFGVAVAEQEEVDDAKEPAAADDDGNANGFAGMPFVPDASAEEEKGTAETEAEAEEGLVEEETAI